MRARVQAARQTRLPQERLDSQKTFQNPPLISRSDIRFRPTSVISSSKSPHHILPAGHTHAVEIRVRSDGGRPVEGDAGRSAGAVARQLIAHFSHPESRLFRGRVTRHLTALSLRTDLGEDKDEAAASEVYKDVTEVRQR